MLLWCFNESHPLVSFAIPLANFLERKLKKHGPVFLKQKIRPGYHWRSYFSYPRVSWPARRRCWPMAPAIHLYYSPIYAIPCHPRRETGMQIGSAPWRTGRWCKDLLSKPRSKNGRHYLATCSPSLVSVTATYRFKEANVRSLQEHPNLASLFYVKPMYFLLVLKFTAEGALKRNHAGAFPSTLAVTIRPEK